MLLELKLCKIGDSVGVVLPEEALAHLKAKEGQTLLMTDAADGSVRLNVAQSDVSRQITAAQDIMQRYSNTLRELAK